jgi:hypothetical protein
VLHPLGVRQFNTVNEHQQFFMFLRRYRIIVQFGVESIISLP